MHDTEFLDSNLIRAFPFVENHDRRIPNWLVADLRVMILTDGFDPERDTVFLAWVSRFENRLRLGVRTDAALLSDEELVFEFDFSNQEMVTRSVSSSPLLETVEDRCGCSPELLCSIGRNCTVELLCDPSFDHEPVCSDELICDGNFEEDRATTTAAPTSSTVPPPSPRVWTHLIPEALLVIHYPPGTMMAGRYVDEFDDPYLYPIVCSVDEPSFGAPGVDWHDTTPHCLAITNNHYGDVEWFLDQPDTICGSQDHSPTCIPGTTTAEPGTTATAEPGTTAEPCETTWAALVSVHVGYYGNVWPGSKLAGTLRINGFRYRYIWICSVNKPTNTSGAVWYQMTPHCMAELMGYFSITSWSKTELQTLCDPGCEVPTCDPELGTTVAPCFSTWTKVFQTGSLVTSPPLFEYSVAGVSQDGLVSYVWVCTEIDPNITPGWGTGWSNETPHCLATRLGYYWRTTWSATQAQTLCNSPIYGDTAACLVTTCPPPCWTTWSARINMTTADRPPRMQDAGYLTISGTPHRYVWVCSEARPTEGDPDIWHNATPHCLAIENGDYDDVGWIATQMETLCDPGLSCRVSTCPPPG